MVKERTTVAQWLYLLVGPILSIACFVVTYYGNIFSLGKDPLSSIPALLFSILVLIVTQSLSTHLEVKKTKHEYSNILETVKRYNHVISIGSPEVAMQYVGDRLQLLNEVWNTSVNMKKEEEDAEYNIYSRDSYLKTYERALRLCRENKLLWKDIGNLEAKKRLKKLVQNSVKDETKYYQYRFINGIVPQINFIILRYRDVHTKSEVLFNWDHRDSEKNPIVLLSQDDKIVKMFMTHYNDLWENASRSHD